MKSWEDSSEWYSGCVGEKGHYYHQSLILPGALRLLALQPGQKLLDLGCGQGILQRYIHKNISYLGLDSSPSLIADAKKHSPRSFAVADVSEPLPTTEIFDAACFILSLQNMEHPEKALANAAKQLNPTGKLLLILNHPCFRIPRQSNWGFDSAAKLQYRRMNLYMTPQKIPIQTHPGKKGSAETISYHYPLSQYIDWLSHNHLSVTALEEWCSDKKSEGAHAKMEDRARREFPLFLALLAEKK